jgi:hypothetical protein
MKHVSDSVNMRRNRLRLSRLTAQTPCAKEGPMNLIYQTFFVTIILFVCLAPLSACKSTITIDPQYSPSSATQVYVHNSTLNVFSTNKNSNPIPVGASSHIVGILSNTPNVNNPGSFDISRNSLPLARVSFEVLRFPAPTDPWMEVYINITEESAGVLGASIPDSISTWINVSIQPL